MQHSGARATREGTAAQRGSLGVMARDRSPHYEVTVTEVFDRLEVNVALRVVTRTVPRSEIVELLGDGTYSHQMGEPTPPGDDARFPWPHTMWLLVRDGDAPLDEYVDDLVTFAEAHSTAIRELQPRCYTIDVYCGVFTGKAHGQWALPPDLMRRAADLGLAVTFELHCHP